MLNLLWHFFYLANFQCSKRPNIEQLIQPSGHAACKAKLSWPKRVSFHAFAMNIEMIFIFGIPFWDRERYETFRNK